jgi:hypothetical protein
VQPTVPGLLQTEDYARAVISAGRPQDTTTAIDRAVGARLERQAILNREHPPVLWHVLHEGVLRHVVGGPAIMRGQLDKLTALAREPGVVIQILPFYGQRPPGDGRPDSGLRLRQRLVGGIRRVQRGRQDRRVGERGRRPHDDH